MPTKKMEVLAESEGKSVVELLKEAYKVHGNQKLVAKALKVSPSTVSTWLARSGYEERTVIVPRESVISEK